MSLDALRTAEQAVARFPGELPPRVLLIELLSPVKLGFSHQWRPEIEAYLRDFGGRPEAVALLAELAGRKGWVDLARTLYEVEANHPQNLSLLALYYGDALSYFPAHLAELGQLLAQIEAQIPESNAAFMVQLRQRQVIAAAARGDHDAAREYARRLAATLHGDPDAVEGCRHVFQKIGIPEAVAELTARAVAVKAPPKK